MMKVELYELQKTVNTTYAPLGSIETEATPSKDTYIFYGDKYYIVNLLVISSNRVVAFVEDANVQLLEIANVF